MAPASDSYPAAFLSAVESVLRNEGGYVNDPYDPGGETKFGISKRQYPDLNIALLTRDDAIAIYYRDYWGPHHLDEMPSSIAAKVFDLAVVMGPREAIICLQRACRACGQPLADDGIAGQFTLDVSHTLAMFGGGMALMAALRSEAAGYFRALTALERGRRPNYDEPFLEGWLKRAYE